jgi:murein DD-endopeptidase MepM/ murein hydrolase activator NlpD
MDPISFQERWSVKINHLQILSLSILVVILFFFVYFTLFSFTPVGLVLPETVMDKSKKQLTKQMASLDKINAKLKNQDDYIKNLQSVILGEIPLDSVYMNRGLSDSSQTSLELDTSTTLVEEELSNQIQNTENDRLKQNDHYFENLFLYEPVNGEISQEYNASRHFGVDVVTKKDEQIKACLDGVVLYTSFNDQDGYTVILSHQNNITSVYKHAQKVMVEIGQSISAGESIAIVGNTGERSTGPHLHFELWSSLGPLDPLDYLSFGR